MLVLLDKNLQKNEKQNKMVGKIQDDMARVSEELLVSNPSPLEGEGVRRTGEGESALSQDYNIKSMCKTIRKNNSLAPTQILTPHPNPVTHTGNRKLRLRYFLVPQGARGCSADPHPNLDSPSHPSPSREGAFAKGFSLAEGTPYGGLLPASAKGARRTGYNATNIGEFTSASAKGFSLAEVLITLGIIGIVAAMTMPTLITNYQKRTTVTKLQKAIANLNHAYRLSIDKIGEPDANYLDKIGGVEYYKTYWEPFLKTTHYCTSYKDCGFDSLSPYINPNNTANNTGIQVNNRYGVGVYTSDGILYMIRAFVNDTTLDNAKREVFIDINGGKKPNKVGRDFFVVTLDSEKGVILPRCYSDTDLEVEKKCSGAEGGCCAEKIRRAGWKMDSTYPW